MDIRSLCFFSIRRASVRYGTYCTCFAEARQACCTRGSDRIVHFTPPATQRASLSRSGELTVASFIKIIDSGHQDSQNLATLTFDTTAGAAQDECPASPSPTVVGWMATRMATTPTTVARLMPVSIAVPLAAVGAREEVAPHCVTDLGDYACRQVLLVQNENHKSLTLSFAVTCSRLMLRAHHTSDNAT